MLIRTDSANYTAIANAIRTRGGTTDTYKPSEMAQAILDMNGGFTIRTCEAECDASFVQAETELTPDAD